MTVSGSIGPTRFTRRGTTSSIPDGVPGAEVMANANASGGLELAKDYWVSFPDGYRAHRIRARGQLLNGFVLLSIGLNLTEAWAPAELWLAVVASGLYGNSAPGQWDGRSLFQPG